MAVVASLFWSFLLLSSSFLVLLPLLTFSLSDSEALLKLKTSFTNAAALESWNSGSVPCNDQGSWQGLLCSNGMVTGLRLEGMGLSGKIDVDALVELKNLRTFSVMNNSFTGMIPEINHVGFLKSLFLSMNRFSGEIPSDFFAKMGSLKKVWLSDNKFTGNIPISLAQMSTLIDVNLKNNQFSGQIPDFNNKSLKSINLSNNKLQGKIPSSLSKFKASSFAGNSGLCGEQIGVVCGKAKAKSPSPSQMPTPPTTSDHGHDKNESKKIIAAIITLALILLSVILFFAIKWRKKRHEDGNAIGFRGSCDEAVDVQVSVPTRREMEAVSKTTSASSHPRGSNMGKVINAVPELVMVNDEKGVFGLPDLMKSAAEVLGNGTLGSSYKAVMTNGIELVVKRMREMNALGKDAFDAEVKRLGMLRHPNILTPLAYHYRIEEKLFVYEYLPKGSLLYQLHGEHDAFHVTFDWPARVKVVQGIAKGLEYLHSELASHEVPHGNLKSSNILLSPENHPFLSDFGFWPLINTDSVEALFAYKTPEAIQEGMVSPKSDVYCLGIIILEILTGKFPSQYLNDGDGGTDIVQWAISAFSEGKQAELIDPEIGNNDQNSLGSIDKLLHVGLLCTQSSHDQRLEMKEAVRLIEEIEIDGDLESRSKTMQILPSLRDGLADAPNSNKETS